MNGLRAVVIAVALTATIAWAVSAEAYRPLATEDTGTLEAGRLEVQFGAEWQRSASEDLGVGRVTLNVGLADRVDARIDGGVALLDVEGERGRGGVGDTNLGVKWRLLDEQPDRPAALVSVVMRLPTGDSSRGLGEPGVDVTTLGALSYTVGETTAMVNAGHTFVTSAPANNAWLAAVALDHRVSKSVSLVGEVASSLGARDGDVVVVRAGALGRIGPSLVIDGAIGVGVTRASPDVIVTVGFTRTF